MNQKKLLKLWKKKLNNINYKITLKIKICMIILLKRIIKKQHNKKNKLIYNNNRYKIMKYK